MVGVFRWILVTASVVFLTTIGINAFDNIDSPNRSLLGAVMSSIVKEPCPSDMVLVKHSAGDFCIDKFEASAGDECPIDSPRAKQDTDANLSLQICSPVSRGGVLPWTHISRQQAELACVRAGKRLPTNEEWYRAALGTPDKNDSWGNDDCNVNSVQDDAPEKTGERSLCVSVSGAHDMIGNVWEWLEETVSDGQYVEQALPNEGYVADIASNGIPIDTNPQTPEQAFFEDYFWIDGTNVRGMLRGGYWKSKSDAGQYALNVTVPPSFIGTAVGFRCVKDVE